MKFQKAHTLRYEEAAWWLQRLEEGELPSAERRCYERWLKTPGHREALHRMQRFSAWLHQLREHPSVLGAGHPSDRKSVV